MPIYDYKCEECGNTKEIIAKIDDKRKKLCDVCNKNTSVRQISAVYGKVAGTSTPTKVKR